MEKSRVWRVLIVIIVLSMVINHTHYVLADYSKISLGLQDKMEEIEENEQISVLVMFDTRIDVKALLLQAADADTYEERYQIIKSMQEKKLSDFIAEYYGNETNRINHKNFSELNLIVYASKNQVLQFSEEELVIGIAYHDLSPKEETEAMAAGVYLLGASGVTVEIKAAAMANIMGYVDLSNYRKAEQEEIQEIIFIALSEINNAKTSAQINKVVTEAENRLDRIKTDEQLTEEEKLKITPPEKDPDHIKNPPDSNSGTIEVSPEPEPEPTVIPPKMDLGAVEISPEPERKSTVVPPKTEQGTTKVSPEPEPESTEMSPKTEQGTTKVSPEPEPESTEMSPEPDSGSTLAPSKTDPGPGVTTTQNGLKPTEKRDEFRTERIIIIVVTSTILSVVFFIKKKKSGK